MHKRTERKPHQRGGRAGVCEMSVFLSLYFASSLFVTPDTLCPSCILLRSGFVRLGPLLSAVRTSHYSLYLTAPRWNSNRRDSIAYFARVFQNPRAKIYIRYTISPWVVSKHGPQAHDSLSSGGERRRTEVLGSRIAVL